MNERTDAPSVSPEPTRKPAAASEPRFALFIATAAGLGYLPLAPGTWGSIGGFVLAALPFWGLVAFVQVAFFLTNGHALRLDWVSSSTSPVDAILCGQVALAILVACLGIWAASRAAGFWSAKDPQRVVIDEVSGQHLALVLGCGLPVARTIAAASYSWQLRMIGLGLANARTPLKWKYLLLGFILFRLFDIWKPFPVRQSERLPGGWGIMADDWIAAIYAALGLWIARAVGL